MRRWLQASIAAWATAAAGCASSDLGGPDLGVPGAIDASADAALRSMGELLGSAERFEFEALTMVDPHPDAWPPFRERGEVTITGARPGRLLGRVRSAHARRDFHLDDGRLSVHDLDRGVYAVIEAPGTIDETLDLLMDEYDVSIQLADVLYADPYAAMSESLEEARDLGATVVGGRPCRHLAFRQAGLEWQLWVEEGERPVPRKIVLLYDEPGTPEFEATWTRWELSPPPDDRRFRFEPPPSAREVELEQLLRPEEER
ncbi:MAG: DUF2092 domain-containing protein [Planctomycetota bacterium JB042]